jgi:hypothetical protein
MNLVPRGAVRDNNEAVLQPNETAELGIATLLGTYAIKHRPSQNSQQPAAVPGQPQPSKRHGGPGSVPTREAEFQWPLALGVVGLVLLGGVWIYVRRRRELIPADGGDDLEAELVAAIETTIDDLRAERDARKAVIAAYAQMERTLTHYGFARSRAEAPLEYLARILRQLNVRDSAVRTLTSLFEYAKFSRHPVDDDMKKEAIRALLAVREDMQAAESVAA